MSYKALYGIPYNPNFFEDYRKAAFFLSAEAEAKIQDNANTNLVVLEEPVFDILSKPERRKVNIK